MTDPELNQWQAEWQTLGADATSYASLAERARHDGKRLQRAAAGEIAGVVFSTAVCVWLAVRSRGALEVVSIVALILAFNGSWITYFFALRQGAFSTGAETVEAFIALTRRRFAIDARWIRFSRRWTIALLFLIVPHAIWFAHNHWDRYRAEPWRAVVGFGGVAVILGGLFVFLHIKERRVRERTEAFESEITRAAVTD